MTDIVPPEKRSRMMSGIKGKDTNPELIVRKEMFKRGFRYRIHEQKLPGKPDLVFPKYKAVVFINGCFWHGHNCTLFKWPKSNTKFWKEKISGTKSRDKRNRKLLEELNWRVLTIWECALKRKNKNDISREIDRLEEWLISDRHI